MIATLPEPTFAPKGLHQISMRYSAVQDRVLLVVSTTDGAGYSFWMTRRFVQALWKILAQVLESFPKVRGLVDVAAREAVLAMRHREALRESDFSTPFAGEKKVGDDGAGAPLLVGLQGGMEKGRDGIVRIVLHPLGMAPFQLTLNEQLLHALSHLLIEVTGKAGWSLGLQVGQGNLVMPEGERRIH